MGTPVHKCTFTKNGRLKKIGGMEGIKCSHTSCTRYQIGNKVYIVGKDPQTRETTWIVYND